MNIQAPFSKRQEAYLYRCMENWFNVAEGGKRGGKNVLQTLIFCMLLETHKNKIHLVAGVSIATAKLNILDCDGYGLLNYFEGRCREGKYQNRDCVYVGTKTGEKIVLISGGGKDGDEKLIKGNTYGMAYVTEANECHPKFLKEVFDRTLSSADRKVFHDLNPKEEEHWYYTDILRFHEKQQEEDSHYGYNYGHFTIADNYSVSDNKLRSILATYDKETVWYRRDIRGDRAVAEGIIFRRFANNNEPYLYDDAELLEEYIEQGETKVRLKKKPFKIVIGIDFGGNESKTTFVATGYFNRYHDFRVLEEGGPPPTSDIDADIICVEFIKFYKLVLEKYGRVDWIFPDSAATTMINSLISAAKKAGLPWRNIKGCRKNAVEERPRTVDLLFNTSRLKINRRCVNLRKAIGSLRWDEKEPNRPEDKNIGNCNDWWDGFCYTLLDFIEYIDLDR
ncbi:MAG: phage terminase large subunit [Lachnospiraceae bacterium]|nr:phage terminase large subunit [Lachnospiraceae bacterium]